MIIAYGIFGISIFSVLVWLTELHPKLRVKTLRQTKINLLVYGLLSLISAQYIWG